jgi:hypothetical protein
MYDTNTVAIVRRCFSERSAPELGFLRPHIAHDHIVCTHLDCSNRIDRMAAIPL